MSYDIIIVVIKVRKIEMECINNFLLKSEVANIKQHPPKIIPKNGPVEYVKIVAKRQVPITISRKTKVAISFFVFNFSFKSSTVLKIVAIQK